MRLTSTTGRVVAGAILTTSLFVGGTLAATGARADSGQDQQPGSAVIGSVSFIWGTLRDRPIPPKDSDAVQRCQRTFGAGATSARFVKREFQYVTSGGSPSSIVVVNRYTYTCVGTAQKG